MIGIPYVDSTIDLQGRQWFVNDRVVHRIPGVRSDAGKICELFPGAMVRCMILFDDGGRVACYFSELALLRRRTADEIPYAALEAQS